MSTPAICRQHQWQPTPTPGVYMCSKCQATGKKRQSSQHPLREQRAVQPPYQHPSPHHAGFSAGLHPEDQPYQSDDVPLTLAPQGDEESGADYAEPSRLPSSTVRYRYIVHDEQPLSTLPVPVVRASAFRETEARPIAQKVRGKQRGFHPLWWLGLGMLAMLALWQAGLWASAWWQLHQQDSTYGRPRTYQCDAVVGHHDDAAHPSHFLVLNLHAQVIIIELEAGDASHSRVYIGPRLYGSGADLVPVTLSFQDANGAGHPDMLLHVQGNVLVYRNEQINGQWQFVSPKQS